MIMDSKAMCVYVGYESGTILHVNLLQRSAVNPSMSLRLTPPSGIYTQWDQKRKGAEVFREHNLTETGCTQQTYGQSLSYYHQYEVSASDEMMQQANSFYIQAYVIVFCAAAIIVAMLQAHIVRSMFEVDPTKIRP
ncbi:hypothetical protein NECAME_02791 [Necator americanus]|uniref:GOLD domain-containing protein n=1 Tax=Necator americanus TaxID=51031 RepID=W2TD43_NECAM|nr:hypothetical protein NECAME_02791 [Necator americanus]ETN78927.1 hypothetical protein NECAME_02791 [Necator americanus]